MNIKTLFLAFALGLTLMLGVNYARSEEALAPAPVCEHGSFVEVVADLSKDRLVIIEEVPDSVVSPIVEKRGLPPESVEGFKMYRFNRLGLSSLLTVNPDGCIAWVSGTTASENVDKFLGIVRG